MHSNKNNTPMPKNVPKNFATLPKNVALPKNVTVTKHALMNKYATLTGKVYNPPLDVEVDLDESELDALMLGRTRRSNTIIAAPSPSLVAAPSPVTKPAPPPPPLEGDASTSPASRELQKSFTFSSHTSPASPRPVHLPPSPSVPPSSPARSIPNSPVHSPPPSPLPEKSLPLLATELLPELHLIKSEPFHKHDTPKPPPPPSSSTEASLSARPSATILSAMSSPRSAVSIVPPSSSILSSSPGEDDLYRVLADLAIESREADRLQQSEFWQTQMADMKTQLEAETALNRELQVLLRQQNKLFQNQTLEKESLQQQLQATTMELILLRESCEDAERQAAEKEAAVSSFTELTHQLRDVMSDSQHQLKKQIQEESEKRLEILSQQLKQSSEERFFQLTTKLEEQAAAAIAEHFRLEAKKSKKQRSEDKVPDRNISSFAPPPSTSPLPPPPPPRAPNKEYVFAPAPTPRQRAVLERAVEG